MNFLKNCVAALGLHSILNIMQMFINTILLVGAPNRLRFPINFPTHTPHSTIGYIIRKPSKPHTDTMPGRYLFLALKAQTWFNLRSIETRMGTHLDKSNLKRMHKCGVKPANWLHRKREAIKRVLLNDGIVATKLGAASGDTELAAHEGRSAATPCKHRGQHDWRQ